MFQLECKIIALDSEKRPLAEKVIKKIKLRAKKKKTFLFPFVCSQWSPLTLLAG